MSVLALGLCALALAAGLAGAGQVFEHETEHYRIRTDISAEFAELVGRHMEVIFQEYAERFRDYGEVDERFQVAVLRTQEGYMAEAPPQVRGSTGVFVSSKRLLAAHAEGRTTEEVLRTLYHEGFHQFMYMAISRKCPVWLNEGLAEYFSEATWNGQQFVLGYVPTVRLHTVREAIREGRHIRLPELFTLDIDRWLQDVRTDARRASLLYSEAWSVVQFLIHADGGRYSEMLNTFLREVADGAGEEEAFQKAFGTDVAAFENAWKRYMLALEPSPKFLVRGNMEAIMLLADMVYDDVRDFEGVSLLRRKLLHSGRYRWVITRPTGETISSEDRQKVAELFRDPFHRENSRGRYVLVTHLPTGMPILVYDDHPGIVIKAYYEPKPDGSLGVAVEEEVRETVNASFRQAVINAKLEQLDR